MSIDDMTPSDVRDPHFTLETLLSELKPLPLTVVAAPSGLGVPVSAPVLFDPKDHVGIQRGDLVLAVGVEATLVRIERILGCVSANGASGLVIKSADPVASGLVEAAEEVGVALLAAPPTVAWGQLFSLLRTVTSMGMSSRTGSGEATLSDLFGLADAIAGTVGGATTIEDTQGHVLAYSNLDQPIDEARRQTILGRKVPEESQRALSVSPILRRLWKDDDVVLIEGRADMRKRMVTAVRAGGEVLGLIWVLEGAQPFGEHAESRLLEAARMAPLYLLRHHSLEDFRRRERADALRGLLARTLSIEQAANRLGIRAQDPVAVVVFTHADLSPDEEEAAASIASQRAANLVALRCESYRRKAICAPIAGVLYVLLPQQTGDEPGRVVAFMKSILQEIVDVQGVELRAGIGSTVQRLQDLPISKHEAEQALATLTAESARTRVVHIEEVRSRTIIMDLVDLSASMPQLRAGRLEHLVDEDRRRATCYIATLRAYLDAFGDAIGAASSLNVHPNTFRYRLQRLCEIGGIDLSDPEERLVLSLQLRILERGGGTKAIGPVDIRPSRRRQQHRMHDKKGRGGGRRPA